MCVSEEVSIDDQSKTLTSLFLFSAYMDNAEHTLIDLGWMEMSKLIPTLFLRFDLELTDPLAEWKETCWYEGFAASREKMGKTDISNRWFVKQDGVHVKLRPRATA